MSYLPNFQFPHCDFRPEYKLNFVFFCPSVIVAYVIFITIFLYSWCGRGNTQNSLQWTCWIRTTGRASGASRTAISLLVCNQTLDRRHEGQRIFLMIIHCTHHLSSHWLRAYSWFWEISSTYRLVSYLLADYWLICRFSAIMHDFQKQCQIGSLWRVLLFFS